MGRLEPSRRDVQLAAVTLQELVAPGRADGVGDERAGEVAERPGQDDSDQREMPGRDVEAREEQDRRRRDRHAEGVGGHQQEDARQAEIADHMGRERDQRVGDGGDDQHGRAQRSRRLE
jgi:hypothetical protein